ncbi:MAG TPA: hypothetical protein O0X19_06460 [Methanocorpusculum sp.]|nr:hypothetical protein [Candidatus Methanocorpusculum equi]MCQ2358368.1 hypothetical protein [Methanocorpusculum sp.]HJJ33995.1 hypothetical protein [Methanocorpusculum sp.]HJJ45304.1 hypothetical protein [Methanocorpusculum sp.]
MSRLSAMIDAEALHFIEPDYSALVNNGEPGVLIREASPEKNGARILLDTEGNPLLFAVKNAGEWYATGWLFRDPSAEELELFGNADGTFYEEERGEIESAFREEFSSRIAKTVTAVGEDLTEHRIEMIRSLLAEKFGTNLSGTTCIDACCGSGIGSSVMRSFGAKPLAYDNDEELLALGFSCGRLKTDEAVCIDGRIASAYMPDADYGVGIMFGQMYSYTKEIWQPIVEELAGITKKTLITVATEEEAHWVQEWAAGVGRDLKISENPRDPIYDRWVCFG